MAPILSTQTSRRAGWRVRCRARYNDGMDAPEKRRWFVPTPAWLICGLLVVEGLLWLSERYRWFWFNEKKGWTVLIAVAVVGAAMVLMLLWWLAALVFRWRFQFSVRLLLMLVLAIAFPCCRLVSEGRLLPTKIAQDRFGSDAERIQFLNSLLPIRVPSTASDIKLEYGEWNRWNLDTSFRLPERDLAELLREVTGRTTECPLMGSRIERLTSMGHTWYVEEATGQCWAVLYADRTMQEVVVTAGGSCERGQAENGPQIGSANLVVGKWEPIGESFGRPVEFRNDGSATFYGPDDPFDQIPNLTVAWRFLDDGHIRMENSYFYGSNGGETCGIKLDGDSMTLSYNGGWVEKYRRATMLYRPKFKFLPAEPPKKP